ncbi:MAG TPA: hypothetical protein VF650_05735 [Allosphingosinicella sp.]|jgi:hypothetical protein
MRRIAAGLLLLALAAPGVAGPAKEPCPPRPQPLGPALDSVARLPEGRSSVAFSAEPSLEHPGRAWVVRANQPRPGEATLESLRLIRRSDCNVYDVETRWQAPLPEADYRALVRAAERVGAPRPDAFSHEDPERDLGDLVTDGTMIELRLKRFGWEARRTLNHYGQGGAAVSAIFRALVDKHVPADERPGEGWGTRRAR